MISLSEFFNLNKACSDSSFVNVLDLANDSEFQKLRVKFARSLYGSCEVVGFSGSFIVVR